MRATRASLVAALALCAGACGQGDPGGSASPLAPTRGYILISLDTLGAAHLGGYGYERPTSPFLDRLSERATVFQNAVVQYPSTLVSHTSLFTGLYPQEHGVYPPNSSLSPEIETLPERMHREGFVTAAFTEGGYLGREDIFGRGFDDYEIGSPTQRAIENTLGKGARFLERLGAEERFFLFLHTYSVHAPYEPLEEFREMFW